MDMIHLYLINYMLSKDNRDFIYSDKTIQQLKSAGNMRLIQNKVASDSIIVYDSNIRDFLIDIDMTLSIF